MERPEKSDLLAKVASALDLPADMLAGLPRVELVGDREVRMENHRGILAYSAEEIHISGGKIAVRIRGAGMELKAMNSNELLIVGKIFGVELVT